MYRIFLLYFLFLPTSGFSAVDENKYSDSGILHLVEIKRSLDQDILGLDEVNNSISRVKDILKNYISDIESYKFDTDEAKVPISRLRTSIDKLKLAVKKERRFNDQDKITIRSFMNAYSDFNRKISSQFNELSTEVHKEISLSIGLSTKNTRGQPEMNREIHEINKKFLKRIPDHGLSGDLENLNKSLRYAGAELEAAEIKNYIKKADTHLTSITDESIGNMINAIKSYYLKAAEKSLNRLDKLLIHNLEKSKLAKLKLENIKKEISKKRSKHLIDQSLVWAVYGLILALPAMFLILKFLPVDVVSEIIRQRSLIETIGMAFMLITIIILGTGGKISSEALGTLLGTIAGFIFGRIGADKSTAT